MRISDWSSDVCSSDLKADAEDGDIGIQQFLNHRHGIFARRGGGARTIGKECASRLLRHDIFKAGGSRKDCHLCARTNTIAEAVTLRPLVTVDDLEAFIACFIQAIPKPAPPPALSPPARFLPRHLPDTIHAPNAPPAPSPG